MHVHICAYTHTFVGGCQPEWFCISGRAWDCEWDMQPFILEAQEFVLSGHQQYAQTAALCMVVVTMSQNGHCITAMRHWHAVRSLGTALVAVVCCCERVQHMPRKMLTTFQLPRQLWVHSRTST